LEIVEVAAGAKDEPRGYASLAGVTMPETASGIILGRRNGRAAINGGGGFWHVSTPLERETVDRAAPNGIKSIQNATEFR
jgi:hypothetical protein